MFENIRNPIHGRMIETSILLDFDKGLKNHEIQQVCTKPRNLGTGGYEQKVYRFSQAQKYEASIRFPTKRRYRRKTTLRSSTVIDLTQYHFGYRYQVQPTRFVVMVQVY